MHTTNIYLSTSPARHLSWSEALYCGERVGLALAGNALASHAPDTSHLLLTDGNCAPLAATGPFAGGGELPWTATLDLATAPLLSAFAKLGAQARITAWSVLVDTGRGSLIGAGEVIIAQNTYPVVAGDMPASPELFVRRGEFADLLVRRPASLTSLADMLAEILKALKGE